MNHRNAKLFQAIVAWLILPAWFLISNHCAIAAVSSHEAAMPGHCPMHAAAKQTPSKNKGCGDQSPCCKTLRALVAKPAKSIGDSAFEISKTYDYPGGLIVRPSEAITSHLWALNPGPPGGCSFAESVLQRSLLAHAPPIS